MGVLRTQVLVISGPPASGKDTVTQALTKLDDSFRLFRKLKCGTGRSQGYRMIEKADFDELLAEGKIVQSHERYGNTYAVDLPTLEDMIQNGLVPVIHNGRMSDFSALAAGLAAWQTTHVMLHLSRGEAERRIRGRDTGDTQARLAAYDEESSQTASGRLSGALTIDTSKVSPTDAARVILDVAYGRTLA